MSRLVDAAVSALREDGLELTYRPAEQMPTLPEDITELDDQGLMTTYADFVSWAQYAAAKLAVAKVDHKAAVEAHKRAESTVVLEHRDSGVGVTEARAQASINPAVLKANRVVMETEAIVSLTESIQESLDKSAALLSRELTRRTSAERTRRVNWTT